VNPVVEWLRSDEGEQWSRDRALASPAEIDHDLETWWRATGPLSAASDPCGRPPEAIAIGTSNRESA
jgi:hypothetical protein